MSKIHLVDEVAAQLQAMQDRYNRKHAGKLSKSLAIESMMKKTGNWKTMDGKTESVQLKSKKKGKGD